MIRVILPQHLQILSGAPREVQLEITAPITQRRIVDALENRYPTLRGTVRDQVTGRRRPMVRFFVCQEDVSLDSPDVELPLAIANASEPFYIIGAIAGG
jgi:sulfur-carrier protein